MFPYCKTKIQTLNFLLTYIIAIKKFKQFPKNSKSSFSPYLKKVYFRAISLQQGFRTGSGALYFKRDPGLCISNGIRGSVFQTGSGALYFKPDPGLCISNGIWGSVFQTGSGALYFKRREVFKFLLDEYFR